MFVGRKEFEMRKIDRNERISDSAHFSISYFSVNKVQLKCQNSCWSFS